jgi:site-specific recombinase XerD
VYKDIKRAARAFRVEVNVAPHSARKIYAVNEYKKDMDIKKVQKLLNHSDEAVTLLYCMADQITERALRKKKERRD